MTNSCNDSRSRPERPRLVSFALTPLVVLSALVGQGTGPKPHKKAAARIDAYLELCATHGWMGSVLVAAGGKVLLEKGYGMANRKKRFRNTKSTLFEVASTTKAVTALAILRLEELGKLSTGDSIAMHLPGVPEKFQDITIYHLLTHTSGMPARAVGKGRDIAEAVKLAFAESSSGAKRKNKVGAAFEYWNAGYSLLAGVIEAASKRSYESFCRKYVLGPAGMRASGFTGEPNLSKQSMAIGYEGPKAVRRAGDHPYGAYDYRYRGMGGLVTSVVDLWHLDRALRAGKILRPESLKKAYRPFSPKFKRLYGCGWNLGESRWKTRRISHNGDAYSFHTDFVRLDEEDGCIIVASNVDQVPRGSIARNVENLLFGGRLESEPPKALRVKKSALARIVGKYSSAKGGTIEVSAAPTGLWIAVDRGAVKHFSLTKVGLERKRRMIQAVKSKRGFLHFGWGRGTIEITLKGKRRKELVVERFGERKGKATFEKQS